jgi:uncharacterized protein (DUF1330 family)
MTYSNPTREQFKFLYSLPSDKPVCMLNLLKFRDRASYERAEASDPQPAISGREAYERYSAEAESAFRRAGGHQMWLGQPMATVIGPTDPSWDLVFVAYYPSVRSFLEMVKSPEYQGATRHRTAALADSRLIGCSELSAGSSFAPMSYSTAA